jgi:hypothetical protein
LAKQGIRENLAEQIIGTSFAIDKKIIKSYLEREHLTSWETRGGC